MRKYKSNWNKKEHRDENTLTPKVGVFMSSENFNKLFAVFSLYRATEKLTGKNDFSKNADILERKIARYARYYKDKKGNDNAAVYFFDNEAGVLIELLISVLQIGEDLNLDYFNKIFCKKKK